MATVASLLCFAHAQDVQFDDDIVSTFLESAETPMKTIKQRGKPQSIENPIRSIKRTGGDNGPSAKPVMHIITAPGCGACNHLKNSVNRGTEARELMGSFDVAYLNGEHAPPRRLLSNRTQVQRVTARAAAQALVVCRGRTSGVNLGTRGTSPRYISTRGRGDHCT